MQLDGHTTVQMGLVSNTDHNAFIKDICEIGTKGQIIDVKYSTAINQNSGALIHSALVFWVKDRNRKEK